MLSFAPASRVSQRSNSAGDAATYRPMRVTGIPSLDQRCAVEIGWLRNLAIAAHPFNDSSGFFCFGIWQPAILRQNYCGSCSTQKASKLLEPVFRHDLDA